MDPIKEQPVLLTSVPSLKLLTKENNYHLGPERWSVIEVWTMQAWGWAFRYVVFRCYLQLLRTGPARETYGMDGGAAKKNWVKKTLPFKIQALLNVRQYIVWRIPSPQAWGEVLRDLVGSSLSISTWLPGEAVLFYTEQRPGISRAENWTEQRLKSLAQTLKWGKGHRYKSFIKPNAVAPIYNPSSR